MCNIIHYDENPQKLENIRLFFLMQGGLVSILSEHAWRTPSLEELTGCKIILVGMTSAEKEHPGWKNLYESINMGFKHHILIYAPTHRIASIHEMLPSFPHIQVIREDMICGLIQEILGRP